MTERIRGFVDDPARQCYGKSRYPSKKRAKLAIRRAQSTHGGVRSSNRPYLCPHCAMWHFGSVGGKVVAS